ncbi:MAG: transketolase C-terminal domain-containing protein [Candidatus Uhrbacteria bacterium]
MLTKSLNAKLFSKGVQSIPTRRGYGDGVVLAGEKDPNVVVLCADVEESTCVDVFRKRFPDRFIEVGVAEQNLAAVAAGMAHAGKIPFASSFATFSPGRNWEQIRVAIAYGEANVKIVSTHGGLITGPDGATHQALEDIALVRVIPNMTVIVPCDALEAKRATIAAAAHRGPVYLRFTRPATPVITTPRTPFQIGQAQIFRTGKDATIIACGPLVYEALLAAECLAGNTRAITTLLARYPKISTRIKSSRVPGYSTTRAKMAIHWTPAMIRAALKRAGRLDIEVINCPTIKPLDVVTIARSAKKTGRVVTVEDHQIIGGLFSAVAETLARQNFAGQNLGGLAQHHPTPITPIGMPDCFGESGEPMELLEKYGMTAPFIIQAITDDAD